MPVVLSSPVRHPEAERRLAQAYAARGDCEQSLRVLETALASSHDADRPRLLGDRGRVLERWRRVEAHVRACGGMPLGLPT